MLSHLFTFSPDKAQMGTNENIWDVLKKMDKNQKNFMINLKGQRLFINHQAKENILADKSK